MTMPAAPGVDASAAETYEPRRVAGLVWGTVGAGVVGGFLLGVLAGGGIALALDELDKIIEIVTGGPVAALAAFALAWRIGRRVRLVAALRYGMAGSALIGAFLVGVAGGPEMADEGPDDMSAWLGTTEGAAGLLLLALALTLAAALSVRRFPSVAPPEPEPSLAERLYGPGADG